MRISPRLLSIFVLALVAFGGGQWFYFESKLQAALPQLEARARGLGFEISYASRAVRGWPFRLEVHYSDFKAVRTAPLMSYAVQAPKAVLLRQLLRSDLSLLYLDSPQFAASASGPARSGDTADYQLTFSAAGAQMSLRSAAAGLARVSTVVDRPAGTTDLFSLGEFSADQAQFHLYWPRDNQLPSTGDIGPRLNIAAQTSALAWAGSSDAPLPATIDDIDFAATVNGADFAPLSPAGLTAWRADGGTLDITKLALNWGDVALTQTTGQIALTKDLQLAGSMEATVTALPKLTYALDKSDALDPASEQLALLTMRLLGAQAAAGKSLAQVAVPLPLTFDRGALRLGPAMLADLGPVARPLERGP